MPQSLGLQRVSPDSETEHRQQRACDDSTEGGSHVAESEPYSRKAMRTTEAGPPAQHQEKDPQGITPATMWEGKWNTGKKTTYLI